jgi:hypothetical protein
MIGIFFIWIWCDVLSIKFDKSKPFTYLCFPVSTALSACLLIVIWNEYVEDVNSYNEKANKYTSYMYFTFYNTDQSKYSNGRNWNPQSILIFTYSPFNFFKFMNILHICNPFHVLMKKIETKPTIPRQTSIYFVLFVAIIPKVLGSVW